MSEITFQKAQEEITELNEQVAELFKSNDDKDVQIAALAIDVNRLWIPLEDKKRQFDESLIGSGQKIGASGRRGEFLEGCGEVFLNSSVACAMALPIAEPCKKLLLDIPYAKELCYVIAYTTLFFSKTPWLTLPLF